MTDDAVIKLARELVTIDSRSALSNIAIADRIEAELRHFEVERVDYLDHNGVAKRALWHTAARPAASRFGSHGYGAGYRLAG